MTKDPNKNANDMGGPSFHPDVSAKDEKQKAPDKGAPVKTDKDDGAILNEDQVPPL